MKGLLRIAFLTVAVLLVQGTWALAGVSGSLNGIVLTEQTHTPVAQAKVTAASASQTSSTTTDNGGHFGFVSLIPDTYTVTAAKEGVIEPVAQRGVTIQADQVSTLTILARPPTKVLGTVTTRVAADLVRPGTTSDVYSVNAEASKRVAVLGGGGSGDQGYAALASLPGAYVAPGQNGWFQNVWIRGGDFDQIGYEFDGIPVNRSFDNYPSTNLSALGQQDIQLYTGAAPANAEAAGLAGFVNQVIKTGSYPGTGSAELAIGGPSLYNKANIEVGGATPNRNFSYYVGIGLIDSAPRVYDNNNGASVTQIAGSPFDLLLPATGTCEGPTQAPDAKNFARCYDNHAYFGALPTGPGGFVLGPYNMVTTAHLTDRENVFNFHIGLPHHNDSGKDDIQLLYQTYTLYTYWQSSYNDWGGANFYNNVDTNGFLHGAVPTYPTAFQYTGPIGGLFTAADPTQAANVRNYAFPAVGPVGLGGPIPLAHRDTYDNGQAIYKLQYQHNIGSNSYLRMYGYLYYSWWFTNGVNTFNSNFVGCCPTDYELTTHSRGVSLQYANQLSPKHLLNVEGSLVTASTVRDNNSQPGTNPAAAFLVSAANPTNGQCFAAAFPGVPQSCHNGADSVDLATMQASGLPAPPAGFAWYIAENGLHATYNTVTPTDYAFSIQDSWKPSDRLLLNIGVREDIYKFGFTPTGGGARTFWFNAYNFVHCVSPNFNGGNPFDETAPPAGVTDAALATPAAGTPCSSLIVNGNAATAGTFVPATLINATANGGAISYPEFEPRIGGTYTFSPDDVIRFSWGKFTQPANAAFEQYNALQQDLPSFIGGLWYKVGFNTPNHAVHPSVSYNSDLSWEHHFAGSQTSFKLTPFYRKTSGQQQNFFIDPKTAFISGANAGQQTSTGVEFQLNMGDFNRNGWAAQLAYTYTYATIKYTPLPNGTSLLSSNNADIQLYNSYTSACAGATPSNSPTSLCGVYGASNALATFPCTAVCGGVIGNPYFMMPSRSLMDLNAQYTPYDIVPAGIQLSAVGFETPHVATLVFGYHKDKWSFIPSVQFHAGQRYGSPETAVGVDPHTCESALASPIAGDPRYPNGGAAGALAFDAIGCSGSIVIPNPVTGNFDQPGAFVQPSQLLAHFTVQYAASSRVSYQLNVANIVNTCFGGSTQPWTRGNKFCQYNIVGGNYPAAGNFYNPGSTFQNLTHYSYYPATSVAPINASLAVDIKL